MGNLPASLVTRVVVNEALPEDHRGHALAGVVLPPVGDSLLSLAVVSARAIEIFCLLTGDKRSERYVPPSGVYLVAAVHSADCLLGNIIIVADSTGAIQYFEANSLISLGGVSGSSEVTCMLLATPALFYSGHTDGSLKVWHLASEDVQHSWRALDSSVQAIAYSQKAKRIVAAFDENNDLRVFLTSAVDSEDCGALLVGAEAPCNAVAVVKSKDLVLGMSAKTNQVNVWDVGTLEHLFAFELPQLRESVELGTKLGIIELVGKSDLLIIGLTGGTTLVSQLVFQNQTLQWIPLKAINSLKGTEANSSFVHYDSQFDVLLLGFSDAAVTIVAEFLNIDVSLEEV